ncbi:hypothetical protein [Burkholderia lata]|uniref:hypothetical protein n=1 Tax=Burkholderia lata (strain ATCC 17760 / DSM 23089 / LMG 22485 / NCIMB 9086 / R18194 / 383) TaxID=482957 RepID=UPI0015818C0F|nr:hypothetical protein [Burkholderia lata]
MRAFAGFLAAFFRSFLHPAFPRFPFCISPQHGGANRLLAVAMSIPTVPLYCRRPSSPCAADAPDPNRDRALLAGLLYHDLHRKELCLLKARDIHDSVAFRICGSKARETGCVTCRYTPPARSDYTLTLKPHGMVRQPTFRSSCRSVRLPQR